MEWSKEETLELIEHFKARGALWDPKHPQYFNKVRKRDAWEDLSKKVGKSVDEVKKKMEILQSGVRREKAKISKSHGTGKGADDIYTSAWFAFESMKFILDKKKPRETPSNLREEKTTVRGSVNDEEEQLSATQAGDEPNPRSELSSKIPDLHSSVYNNTPAPAKPPQTLTSASRNKRTRTNEDQWLDKAFEILQSASAPTDECYHFGNFVAAKLRQFDNKTRMSVQSAMMNVLAQATEGTFPFLSSGNGHASPSCSVSSTPTHPSSGIAEFNHQSSDTSHNSSSVACPNEPAPPNYPQPFVSHPSSQYQKDSQGPPHSYEDETCGRPRIATVTSLSKETLSGSKVFPTNTCSRKQE